MCQITRTLPTTKTYPTPGQRCCHYWPGLRGADGALCVQQGRKAASYVVREDAGVRLPLRRWELAKISDESGTVHNVTAGPRGWECDCDGFRGHRGVYRCCHVDSLAVLLAAGDLDGDPRPGPGPARVPAGAEAGGW